MGIDALARGPARLIGALLSAKGRGPASAEQPSQQQPGPMALALLMRKTAAGAADDGEWDAAKVAEGLWVGGLSAAEDQVQLKAHGIAHVVTVASRLEPQVPEGTEHTKVELEDHPCANLFDALPRALQAIDNADGAGTLVHCASGISRSVATIVAWLMTRRGQSMDTALETVRAVRPHANPNAGFMLALQELELSPGDVEAAASRFRKKQDERGDLREVLRGLRESANEMHSRADTLEEQLARARNEGFDCSQIIKELQELEQRLDAATSEQELPDKVARCIRRAASQKVARLLGKE